MAALWRRLSSSLGGRFKALLLLIWPKQGEYRLHCHSRDVTRLRALRVGSNYNSQNLMEQNTWMSIRPIDLRKVAILSRKLDTIHQKRSWTSDIRIAG